MTGVRLIKSKYNIYRCKDTNWIFHSGLIYVNQPNRDLNLIFQALNRQGVPNALLRKYNLVLNRSYLLLIVKAGLQAEIDALSNMRVYGKEWH